MPSRQAIEDFAAKLPPELREEFRRLMTQPATHIPHLDFMNIPITGVVPGFNRPATPREAPFEVVIEDGVTKFVRRKKKD